MSLFIVPAAHRTAMLNLQATVANRVDPRQLAGLGKGTLEEARSAADGVGAWGTKAGDDGTNIPTWEALTPGDWVLFYSRGHFPFAGRVLARERSAKVASRLWGAPKGGTWRYMYLLDEVRRIDASLASVIAALGYSDGFRPQRFSRVARTIGASSESIEALIRDLSRQSLGLEQAIQAAASGDDAAIAAAIDSVPGEISEAALREIIAAHRSSAPPKEVRAMAKRIVRNAKLAADLKALYEGRCQYCNFTFPKKDGTPYSEAAHIRRISLREADLDVHDNLVVLCPNHHKMLDFGPLEIRYDAASGRLIGEKEGKVKTMTNKHIGIESPPPTSAT